MLAAGQLKNSGDGNLPPAHLDGKPEGTGEDSQDFEALFHEWRRTRHPHLRDRLIQNHMNLVHYLAHKFKDRGESMEDVVQQGLIGLINAIDRFDPNRGIRFATYATPIILGEIKRYFRDKSHHLRVPRKAQELHLYLSPVIDDLTQGMQRSPTIREIADAIGVPEEEIVEALEIAQSYNMISLEQDLALSDEEEGLKVLSERVGQLDNAMEVFTVRNHIKDALAVLNLRERAVVIMHFFEGLTQSDIAKQMGISQMQVSRIKHSAVARLRQFFRGDGL